MKYFKKQVAIFITANILCSTTQSTATLYLAENTQNNSIIELGLYTPDDQEVTRIAPGAMLGRRVNLETEITDAPLILPQDHDVDVEHTTLIIKNMSNNEIIGLARIESVEMMAADPAQGILGVSVAGARLNEIDIAGNQSTIVEITKSAESTDVGVHIDFNPGENSEIDASEIELGILRVGG